jgi:hypothetical protein
VATGLGTKKKTNTDEHRKNKMNTDKNHRMGQATCLLGVYRQLSVFIGVPLFPFNHR